MNSRVVAEVEELAEIMDQAESLATSTSKLSLSTDTDILGAQKRIQIVALHYSPNKSNNSSCLVTLMCLPVKNNFL